MSDSSVADQTTWSRWILDAIRKIRSQKQRPSVERICHAIRQHHNFHEEVVSEHLEVAVKEGTVLKVFNKGQSSYKDPGGMQSRCLKIHNKADLSKVIAKAVRELGERDGSSLKNIEKYLKQSHTLDISAPDVDLRQVLRMSVKRAVSKGIIVQEGKNYKSAEFHTPSVTSSSPVTPKKKKDTKELKEQIESPTENMVQNKSPATPSKTSTKNNTTHPKPATSSPSKTATAPSKPASTSSNKHTATPTKHNTSTKHATPAKSKSTPMSAATPASAVSSNTPENTSTDAGKVRIIFS